MFKIVQTLEKGKKQLTIVPEAWESDGFLAWPKFGAEKLAKISDSFPEENWFTIKCRLKRNHLINYDIAEEELERMLEYDDTEQETGDQVPRLFKRARVHLPKHKNTGAQDFNTIAKACLSKEAVVLQKSPVNASPENDQPQLSTSHESVAEIIPAVEQTYLDLTPIETNDNPTSMALYLPATSSDSILLIEKLDKILANQNAIMQNQNILLESLASKDVQKKLVGQMAKIETMFDTLVSNSRINPSTHKVCKCNEKANNSVDDIDFKIIESASELENLEKALIDNNIMKIYIEKFSFICGRTGNDKGLDNCYLLVDRMFSRKFMNLCSWAGGARDQQEKVAFKTFKHTIRLFHEIIYLLDTNFSLKNCEDFFKNVIRNSKKRQESFMIRTSRTKSRPRNLSYKDREKNEESENLNSSEVEEARGIIDEVQKTKSYEREEKNDCCKEDEVAENSIRG